jgi:DNA-binding beta-propeller fold protein YncE
MLDASKPKLRLVNLGLPAGEGLSLVTPVAVKTNDGRKLAMVPHDRKQSDNQEKVSVIDLDPNKDSDLSDAKLVSTIDVGPSMIDGHSGHHDVSVSPNKRLACISNSGDGSVWIIALNDFTVQAKLSVGGSPARVIAQ